MIPYNYHIPASQYVMPMPRSIEDADGTVKLHLGSAYCLDEEFKSLAPLLESQLGLNDGCEDVLLKKSEKPLAEEAYQLKITKEQVVARASTVHGMFNAMQTVRQLLIAGDGILPCCRIEDEPLYTWRGFMLDCSRHFFSVKEILKLIDVAAMHHLNVFHWHLTDDQGWRFPVEGYPLLEKIASKRIDPEYQDGRMIEGFYSKEDIKTVVDYATERMVTVVPEIECPGHASALLAAYPELGCKGEGYHVESRWGIFPEVLCPGNEQVFTFLKAAIASLASMFPSPYLHIGGDECPHEAWEACPKCQRVMEENHLKDSNALQLWFTKKVVAIAKENGKQCIGWDEAIEYAKPGDLDASFIVMSWRGEQGGLAATKAGHRVIMCPNTEGLYLDYRNKDDAEELGNIGVSTLEQIAAFSPRKESMTEEEQKLVLGSQGNLWTEKVRCGVEAEYLLYPRLALIAERLWNPMPKESINDRLVWEQKKLEKLGIASFRGTLPVKQ